MSESFLKELTKQKYSYFDSFIGYLTVMDDGKIESPPEDLIKLFPHSTLTLS